MTQRLLGLRDVAERVGLSHNTVASYIQRGLMAEPDYIIGLEGRGVNGWLPETIDKWQANRPRAGKPC